MGTVRGNSMNAPGQMTTAPTTNPAAGVSQGPAHASVTGIAHANAHSVLASGAVPASALPGLTTQLNVTNANGTSIGTVSQIVLAWTLRKSPVMLPIPGTSRVDHLEENVAAARIVLSDAEMAALDDLPAST